jgi:hypothetical protein
VTAVEYARPRPTVVGELWLSAVEFEGLWEILGLGDRPAGLALPSPGRTVLERQRILARVLEQLRRHGLAARQPRGLPHRWVTELLGTLAGPRRTLELHVTGGRVALAALAGDRATLAARHGEQVWAASMVPGQVVPTLIGMLGEIKPGVARPVSMAAEVFDAARESAGRTPGWSEWTVADELSSRGVARTDASSLARSFAGVRMVAQFTATGTVEGREHPGPWAVGLHRGETGHFVSVRRPGEVGDSVSVAPVDAPRLTRHLVELLSATR